MEKENLIKDLLSIVGKLSGNLVETKQIMNSWWNNKWFSSWRSSLNLLWTKLTIENSDDRLQTIINTTLNFRIRQIPQCFFRGQDKDYHSSRGLSLINQIQKASYTLLTEWQLDICICCISRILFYYGGVM